MRNTTVLDTGKIDKKKKNRGEKDTGERERNRGENTVYLAQIDPTGLSRYRLIPEVADARVA